MIEARAWVSLGSNLGDRLQHLRSAAAQLHATPDIEVIAASRIYETAPLGPSEHPFLNAALELRTHMEPRALLEILLEVERAHGRLRDEKWAARTLDLDLLLYRTPGPHSTTLDEPGLTLPHPELHRRDFVLVPLVDLGLNWPVHAGQTPAGLLQGLSDDGRTILHPRPEPLLPLDEGC